MNVHAALVVLLAAGITAVGVSALAVPANRPAPTARPFWVYLGTYTGAKSKGIYVCKLDAETGRLSAPQLAAEAENPTWLAVHPRLPALYAAERPVLYAANEVGAGTVSAYTVNRETGRLTLLDRQSSRGGGPCHLSVDRTGRCLLVANYGGGSIAVLPIQSDGRLVEASAFIQHTGSSVNQQRQAGPHAHWIDVDAANRFAFVCDLGLDKVLIYALDAARGTLTAHEPAFAPVAPGAGPRHLAFHPQGRWAYVINELANTITGFSYDAERGVLKEIETVPTLPADFRGRNTTAEIEVHPSGKFLYGSNRGHDSIAVYALAPDTGRLTLLQHQPSGGRTPRNFALDPTGRWLLAANQDSDNVVVFRLEADTGRLTPTGQTVAVGRPVCVTYVPAP